MAPSAPFRTKVVDWKFAAALLVLAGCIDSGAGGIESGMPSRESPVPFYEWSSAEGHETLAYKIVFEDLRPGQARCDLKFIMSAVSPTARTTILQMVRTTANGTRFFGDWSNSIGPTIQIGETSTLALYPTFGPSQVGYSINMRPDGFERAVAMGWQGRVELAFVGRDVAPLGPSAEGWPFPESSAIVRIACETPTEFSVWKATNSILRTEDELDDAVGARWNMFGIGTISGSVQRTFAGPVEFGAQTWAGGSPGVEGAFRVAQGNHVKNWDMRDPQMFAGTGPAGDYSFELKHTGTSTMRFFAADWVRVHSAAQNPPVATILQ